MAFFENRQFSFAIITKVIIVILGILASIFINRYLGLELKGEYTYLLNLINIFAMVFNLGIYQSYPFFKRKNIIENQKSFVNIVFFQFFMYLLIFIVIFFLFYDANFKIIFILIPLNVLVRQLSFIFLVEKPNLRNLSLIFNQLTFVIFLIMIYFLTERSNIFMLLILFLKDLIQFLILFIVFKIKANPFKIDIKILIDSIKFGFLPMLTAVLIFLNYRIDIFVLKFYVSYGDIGIYSIGIGLAEMAYLIPDAFKEILFSKNAKKDSLSELIFSLKVNFYLSILMLVGIVIFGEFAIELLYGIEFVDAYSVTIVIFSSIIPMIFYKLIFTLFLAQGKNKLSFILLLSTGILNLILNLILIPSFGINGAAFSGAISGFVSGVLFFIFFIKFEKVRIIDCFLIKKEDFTFLTKIKK